MDTVNRKVHGKFAGFLERRLFKKVIGQESFLRAPALVRIHRKQFRDQLNGALGQPLRVRKIRSQGCCQTIGEAWLVVRRLEFLLQFARFRDRGPVFLRWMTAGAKDQVKQKRFGIGLE